MCRSRGGGTVRGRRAGRSRAPAPIAGSSVKAATSVEPSTTAMPAMTVIPRVAAMVPGEDDLAGASVPRVTFSCVPCLSGEC